MKYLTADQLRAHLAEGVKVHGLRGYARLLNVAPSHLGESISQKRAMSGTVMKAAGFEVRYVLTCRK